MVPLDIQNIHCDCYQLGWYQHFGLERFEFLLRVEDDSTDFTTQYRSKICPEVTRNRRKPNEAHGKVSEILFHLQEIELSNSVLLTFITIYGDIGCPSTQVNSVW